VIKEKSIQQDKWKELEILQDVVHPNIVQYFGFEFDAHKRIYGIIMELAETDLDNWLKDSLRPKALLKRILAHISRGLEALHNRTTPIIHRDIKPSNILIFGGTEVVAKLADFGLSRIVLPNKAGITTQNAGYGTAGWMSPEQLNSKDRLTLTPAVDIFSFGLVAHFILMNRNHLYATSQSESEVVITSNILLDKRARHESPQFSVFEYDALLTSMTNNDPSRRPTIEEIIGHPLMSDSETIDEARIKLDKGNKGNHVSPAAELHTTNKDLHQVSISNKVWLILNEKLGSGAFSEVFKGYKENKSCEVAVKRVKLGKSYEPKGKQLDQLLGIGIDLQSTRHPNLVECFFTELKDNCLYYVMELANYSLENWIKIDNHDNEILTKVCKDVATGLKALHEKRIVHQGIKPQNVLIFIIKEARELVPIGKLSDFGISRISNEDQEASFFPFFGFRTTKGLLGTQAYLPPEAKKRMNLELSFDIFSLGILFGYTMTGGQHIFSWPGQSAKFVIMTKTRKTEPNWSLLGEKKFTALKNLLQVMLSNDPKKRGTISEILEHPFFWTYEESYQFLVRVSKEVNNEEACKVAVTLAAQKFLSDLPDWKLRLHAKIQEWINKKEMELHKRRSFKRYAVREHNKYNGRSIIQLINFIRDQDEHYLHWLSSELEDEIIFGDKHVSNYRSYFMRTFPELPTLLYNVLQDSKFQRRETAMYYKHNVNHLFELTS